MAMFRKEGDVLDLTNLQRRGILKKSQQIQTTNSKSEVKSNDYLDISTPQQSSNPLSFLDSLANATPAPQQSPDFSDIKVKIENFEYKLDRLMERLEAIEAKMQKN